MTGPRWIALTLLAVVAVFPFVAPYYANQLVQERILRFQSDIAIRDDGSLLVTETVSVHSTGDQIKHGIYRDFPTEYRAPSGNRYSVPFEVVEVQRDGRLEPYRMINYANGKRVYIGQESVLLQPGLYTYRLVYRTGRQLGIFPDHTELYWNVTGSGWAFPIDVASATVTLPPRARQEGVALRGYTGHQGAQESHLRSGLSDDGIAWFETTRPLATNEGLTILAAWPSVGVDPGPLGWLDAHRVQVLGAFGVAALFLYYLGAWLSVGKDPTRGTIIPLYQPPNGLSPAAMRYLRRMDLDDKGFAAALVDLAVRRVVQIDEVGGVYTIRRKEAPGADLPTDEARAIAQLLGGQAATRLVSTNHVRVRAARQALQAALNARYGRRYFQKNGRAFWIGALLSVPLLVALPTLAGASDARLPSEDVPVWLLTFALVMPIALVGIVALIVAALRAWKATLAGGPRRSGAPFAALPLTLAVPFALWAGGVGLRELAVETSDWVVVAWSAVMALHVVFQGLLPAPTPFGRGALDRIEGFRRYLGVAERERLKLLNPPERTPELFERYLPYALALDVEGPWGEQFRDVLSQSERAPTDYSPSWYRSSSSWSSPASFAGSLSSSLSGAISSSSTAPGSSSGGGGGGSSGGGGGGGGGGGW